jgi:hypothetical protein
MDLLPACLACIPSTQEPGDVELPVELTGSPRMKAFTHRPLHWSADDSAEEESDIRPVPSSDYMLFFSPEPYSNPRFFLWH